MSAIAEPTAKTPAAPRAEMREPRPSFLGSVGSEILKLRRQGMLWTMLGLALFFFAVITAALASANVRQNLDQSPSTFLFTMYDAFLAIFDTGAGIFLLIVSARLVGMEYSAGTIRVLLARGAGRLRLLLAKVAALALLGLALLAGFLVLATATVYAIVASAGKLQQIGSLPSVTWTDLGHLVLVALASIAVAILLGTTAAVLGRSLAFGIAAALVFFPLDNFVTIVLPLISGLTRQQFWLHISAYLLGPNLNALPVLLQPDHKAHNAFPAPLVTVDATHAWLVVAVWAAAFAIVSAGLTWRRDVLS